MQRPTVGVIDLDDIVRRSFPICQMFSSVVSASVKDWTRSVYCRRGLGTPSHEALKPQLIGCLPKPSSYAMLTFDLLIKSKKEVFPLLVAVSHHRTLETCKSVEIVQFIQKLL